MNKKNKIICPIESNNVNSTIKFTKCLEKNLAEVFGFDLLHNKKCQCYKIINSTFSPLEIETHIKKIFGKFDVNVIVNGPFENRMAIICFKHNKCFLSFNKKIKDHPLYINFKKDFLMEYESDFISSCQVSDSMMNRLSFPKIKLAALYHPENFPLPRFALGISDIARSIREEYMGQVSLSDMQLNKTVEDLTNEISVELPDIIGVSITFGQQDVLEKLLSYIRKIENYTPLIVVGGSLAVLNSKKILTHMNSNVKMVGLGAGESSFKGIIEYWHAKRDIHDIDNIMYINDCGLIDISIKNKTRSDTAGIPELDLLPGTLENKGVMQLEATRGCSYACSFCPREHKGIWSAQSFDLLNKILPEISNIYKRYPEIVRKIFLVDEEFFGYKNDGETTDRIFNICNILNKYGFKFESSARVDQVYRRSRDKDWHVERIKLWKYLVNNGMDRMLFGVESGVESVLERFNKKTKKFQNEYAIRILSALEVPVRLTYITFDPLMSMDELIESYCFQGRTDLLMKPMHNLSEVDLYDSIHSENFVSNHSQNRPLYREISYMLVSMECLLNSKYLEKVENLGLAREYNYSMGKRNAVYLDPRIGLMSYNAQLWIDRNFSLDYTVKSIEKIAPRNLQPLVRKLRETIKDFAYNLLGKFLIVVNQNIDLANDNLFEEREDLQKFISRWQSQDVITKNQDLFEQLMNDHFDSMKKIFMSNFLKIKPSLRQFDAIKMEEILEIWKNKREWTLINKS